MSWWNSMDFLAWWHPRWADQRIVFCFWFDRSFFGHVESTWAWSKICWAICSCTIHESNKYSWLVTWQSADKTVWSTLPGKEGWEACNELSNLQRTQSQFNCGNLVANGTLSFLTRTQIKLIRGIGLMATSALSDDEDLSCTCSQSLTSMFCKCIALGKDVPGFCWGAKFTWLFEGLTRPGYTWYSCPPALQSHTFHWMCLLWMWTRIATAKRSKLGIILWRSFV